MQGPARWPGLPHTAPGTHCRAPCVLLAAPAAAGSTGAPALGRTAALPDRDSIPTVPAPVQPFWRSSPAFWDAAKDPFPSQDAGALPAQREGPNPPRGFPAGVRCSLPAHSRPSQASSRCLFSRRFLSEETKGGSTPYPHHPIATHCSMDVSGNHPGAAPSHPAPCEKRHPQRWSPHTATPPGFQISPRASCSFLRSASL